MLLALWKALADFLYHPPTYQVVQGWLALLALWWAYQAWRWRETWRAWFVPAGGLVLSQAVGLLLAGWLLAGSGRYTPWWLLRAVQVAGAYFLLWAWMHSQEEARREMEWYRGAAALLMLVSLAGALVLHPLGPSRWRALETLWLIVGALVSAGGFAATAVMRPQAAPWPLTLAGLFTIGFVADGVALGHWRGAVRLAELAAYPLLLWWPEVFSWWQEERRQWQERWQTLERRWQQARARLEEAEAELASRRAATLAGRGPRNAAWCARGGYPFWQAFAETLRTVQASLDSLASVWRSLSSAQRDALLRLEAVAHFHQHALSLAARGEPPADDWMPWAHIWNRVLEDLGIFAQTRDQTLILALPDEVFTWRAPETPAYHALYFILARALWVSPQHSEVLVQGQVVQMEPGGLGVMIEVTDRGPVLSEEEQVRIFFATEDEEPMADGSDDMGTNLGLRLARRQLLAAQGALWMTPARDGRGNTVTALIPTRRVGGPEAVAVPETSHEMAEA